MSALERLDEALACIGRPPGDIKSPSAIFGLPEDLDAVLAAARAYRDLLANGQRVEWCEEHDLPLAPGWKVCLSQMWTGRKASCRIVSRLLSVYPKEAENGH